MKRRRGNKPRVTELKYRPPKRKLVDAWQDVIRQEIQVATAEPEYVQWLQEAVADHTFGIGLPAPASPLLSDLEQALQQGCRSSTQIKTVWQPWLQMLYGAKNKKTAAADLLLALQAHDWLERFIARHTLVARGGEMVEPLSEFLRAASGPIRDGVYRVLYNISVDTTAKLGQVHMELLCSRCLARCSPQWIDLPLQRDTTFYGCRLCQQSRNFLHHPAPAVAVLDEGRRDVYWLANDQLQVNWFVWQELFDFDQVLIVQASDEAVERFVVMVGNDTDPYRTSRYKDMICGIGQHAGLSDNSLKILKKTFAQVTKH